MIESENTARRVRDVPAPPCGAIRGSRGRGVLTVVAFLLAIAGVVAPQGTGSAQAVSITPGAGAGQVDVTLSAAETRSAATSLWGSAVVCAAAGARGGPAGIAAVQVVCMSMVTVCAARGRVHGQRGAFTVPVWNPYGAWCWRFGTLS